MLPLPSTRLVPCLRLLPAVALAAWLLPASPAQADCAPDGALSGSTVTCIATDANGFDAGAEDDLSVSVEPGASVSNGNVAGVDAIRVNDLNDITVEATGTVTAGGAGSNGIAGDANNVVLNQGSIAVTGDNGTGVLLGDGANVVNEGAITTTGNGGVGIQIGNDGELRNQGNIIAGSTLVSGSVGIRMGTGNQGETPIPGIVPPEFLLNSGMITATGTDSIGIDAGDTNIFTNTGIVRATGTNGIGVRLGADNNFTNRGSILVDGDMARGIVSNGDNQILNLGVLQVDVSDAMGPRAILGSAGIETVDNQGRITGSIDLSGGDDILRLYTGSTLDARISNTDPGLVDGGADADSLTLLGMGSGFLDLDPVEHFETLLIDGGGQWVLSGAAAFANGATLQSGTIALADTVTLTGDYEQQAGTTLLVQVDPAGPDGSLAVIGDATLFANTTLGVFQASPILTDTTVTVLSATGTLTGTFANIPASTGVLSFSLDTSLPDRIDLNIVRASYASLAGTPNQEAVADYLDGVLVGSPSDDVNAALIELDGLAASALPDAYDQLHPEAYDAHTGALAAVGYTLASVAARERLWCKPPLSELRPGRYQEVPCGRNGYSLWMEAITGVHDRDTGADWFESDGSTQAMLGGLDWRPDRRVVVSVWAGLSSVDLDVDDSGEGDFETYEFGVSTLARVAGVRARAALGYGRGSHEQDREIDFPAIERTASGEFDSNRVLGLLELGYVLELGGLVIEPQAGLDVTWIQEEQFDEEGAVDLGLSVDERSNTLVSTTFGARLAYRHAQRAYVDPGPSWTQGVWTPEISGRWRSTWTGADREIDARLLGAPDALGTFTTEARDTEQGAELGARLTFQPHGAGGSVSVGYDGYFGDGGTSHRFGATLKLHF